MKTALPKEQLVRTTVRLPRQRYELLKHLSAKERRPIQTIVDEAIKQYELRKTTQKVEEIFKYVVKAKAGQLKKPLSRAELYEDVLAHRVRSHR